MGGLCGVAAAGEQPAVRIVTGPVAPDVLLRPEESRIRLDGERDSRRSRLRLGANDKASGVYLVAPDREETPLGLTPLGLTHVARDDAVSQCCRHLWLLNAVAHQQSRAGLLRRASRRDADNEHRIVATAQRHKRRLV